MIAQYAGPPLLGNIFQRNADSDTASLLKLLALTSIGVLVGFKVLVEFISSDMQCSCVCNMFTFSGISRRIVLIRGSCLGPQLKCE